MVLPFKAQPQGSKKAFMIGGKPVLVEASKDLKTNRLQLTQLIIAKCAEQGWRMVEAQTPVSLSIVFIIRKPASVKRDYPAVRPDVDKLARFVLDAASGVIYEDDAQVINLDLMKQYGDQDLISIGAYVND
jgi:Holliday junction resolvase RusA-like endonuclease